MDEIKKLVVVDSDNFTEGYARCSQVLRAEYYSFLAQFVTEARAAGRTDEDIARTFKQSIVDTLRRDPDSINAMIEQLAIAKLDLANRILSDARESVVVE